MTYTVGVIAAPIEFAYDPTVIPLLARILVSATHGHDDIKIVMALRPNLLEKVVQEMALLYEWRTAGVSGNLAENYKLDCLVRIGSDLSHIDAVTTAKKQGIPVFEHNINL